MSKLPNAPLVEIILELRWKIVNKIDLSKVQYLHGDMYSELKDKYPFRESIVPTEIPIDVLINQPIHRFRSGPNEYPLIQVGPGIITLNTTDSNYYWETFSKWSDELIDVFLRLFTKENSQNITPSILYLDFFTFDFEKDDVHQFINKMFNISLSQSFVKPDKPPTNLNLGYYYELPLGNLSVVFQKGKNEKKEDGILLQTRLDGKPLEGKREVLNHWINESHEVCGDLFKKLTDGDLYKSFK